MLRTERRARARCMRTHCARARTTPCPFIFALLLLNVLCANEHILCARAQAPMLLLLLLVLGGLLAEVAAHVLSLLI